MVAPTISMPALIALGGPPGVGKTSLSTRLSIDWCIPRLSADAIGRTLRSSHALQDQPVNAMWLAYDVLFELCAEYIQAGVSVILDLNLGWAFHWQRLDAIREQHQPLHWLPIVLRCPREHCLARIRHRLAADPVAAAPAEVYLSTPQILEVWSFLEQLDRPDVHFVDAAQSEDQVYDDVAHYLTVQGRAR